MQKLLHGTAVLSLALFICVIAPQRAHAQWVVTDPSEDTVIGILQTAVTNAISTMMNNITSSITGLQTSLNDILTKGFTQEANYQKAQVGALEGMTDASNTANAQFLRSIRNAQVRDQHILSPEACIALNSGQSMTAAAVQAAKVSAAISNVMDGRGEGVSGTPAWSGQGQAMAAISQLHWQRYCNQDEAQDGLCTRGADRRNQCRPARQQPLRGCLLPRPDRGQRGERLRHRTYPAHRPRRHPRWRSLQCRRTRRRRTSPRLQRADVACPRRPR